MLQIEKKTNELYLLIKNEKKKLNSITELHKYMYVFNLFIGSLGLKETVLIIGIVLLVVAIIIGIGIALYIKRWRKKNDLELLGYPPKVPPPRSNTSSGMMSRSANSSGYSVRKQNL